MNSYRYKNFIVDVLDEPSYRLGSPDNNFIYSRQYLSNGAHDYPISIHGIKIFQNQHILESCIVIGAGSATGIHKNSSIIDHDNILVCCCDTVFCLTLPQLDLKWKTQADQATCFQIFKQQDDYIIHGEVEVTKLDKDGNKKWGFGGADIFVSIDNEEAFKLDNDGILLTDFTKTKYKIDFEGRLLWDSYKR